MTSAPLLCARVELHVEGTSQPAIGYASDLLVPRWFDKSPDQTLEQERQGLIDAARGAADVALEAAPATLRELVDQTTAAAFAGTPPLAPERLRLGFGVALLERAVIDALSRAHGLSFAAALRTNLFGLDPHVVAALPAELPKHIDVRHTVGMADALRDRDLTEAERDDPLPRSLEAETRAHGLRLFKIKIGAGRAADHARLLAVHEVVASTAGGDWRCSLDANEQYQDLDALEGLLDDLEASAAGRDLGRRLLHLEQPLPRALTFAASTGPAVTRLARRVPLLIDEADVDAEAFAAARGLGYTGVSVKNCKGVLRAVANHAACADLRAHGVAAFQSAEDLTNLPVLALQQDLATVQALGLTHAERNGHHYFPGLDHLPATEAAAAAAAHDDLYRQHGRGHVLRIEGGRLALASLACPGYGYACAIDFEAREPLRGE